MCFDILVVNKRRLYIYIYIYSSVYRYIGSECLLFFMYAMVVMLWHCRAGNGGQWMTDGCLSDSNQTHTTCTCDHLTSFAVIMSPTSPNVITQSTSPSFRYVTTVCHLV